MAEINSWNVSASSNTSASPDGWPENMTFSAVNDSAREDMAVIARWHKDTNGSVAVTGTNTYAADINADNGFALYDGFIFCGDFANANSTAATINLTPDGGAALGAKAIKKLTGVALVSGDIKAGAKVFMVYDGTNFQMLSPVGNIPSTATHPSSTDEALARYDSTAGNLQNSGWLLDNSNVLTAGGNLAGADKEFARLKLKDYAETVVAKGNLGATPAFDVSTANVQTGTVDQNISSSTMTNWPATGIAGSLTIFLTNGNFTIVWPTSVDWDGGTAPSLPTAGLTVLTFTSIDAGTIVHGMVASLASS